MSQASKQDSESEPGSNKLPKKGRNKTEIDPIQLSIGKNSNRKEF